MYDAIIVGAGLSGAVMAERLASQAGWRVLILEERQHLAGNCHDESYTDGILIHRYGPHIFHTDRAKVLDYLSGFTDWIPYEHRVLGRIDGKLVPLPFNLNSIDALFPPDQAQQYSQLLLQEYGDGARVPILLLRQNADALLRQLADYVYEKVFRGYSLKQWGIDPDQLDPEVTGRVPVLVSRDNRYFQDPYQAIPAEGYTKMVEQIVDHPRIDVRLSTPMHGHLQLNPHASGFLFDGKPYAGQVIYTGMIDALFGFKFGALPYRSLRFELEQVSGPWQPVATVNYPNEQDFTRITEFGHFVGKANGPDVIMREYPMAYDVDSACSSMPYYPLFTQANQTLFERYKQHAAGIANLTLLGRLAEYKYYDMDDAVYKAMQMAAKVYDLSNTSH